MWSGVILVALLLVSFCLLSATGKLSSSLLQDWFMVSWSAGGNSVICLPSSSRLSQTCSLVGGKFQEQESRSCKSSSYLGSKFIRHHSCHILLVKASYEASPNSKGGEIPNFLTRGTAKCFPGILSFLFKTFVAIFTIYHDKIYSLKRREKGWWSR